MDRDVAHGAMGRRIDPSWWTDWAISRSSQCSTTGVTKAVVCVILLLIEKSSLYGGSGFHLSLSEWSFTICLTPYYRKQNVLSASLDETVASMVIISLFFTDKKT